MTAELTIFVPGRRDLRRLRIKLAIWFTFILTVFVAAVATGAATQTHVVFGVVFMLAVYFVPTFVACYREHHQRLAIFVLNLVFGWSFLGWIAAFIWACTRVRHD